jgi:hypothetical protein
MHPGRSPQLPREQAQALPLLSCLLSSVRRSDTLGSSQGPWGLRVLMLNLGEMEVVL